LILLSLDWDKNSRWLLTPSPKDLGHEQARLTECEFHTHLGGYELGGYEKQPLGGLTTS
jgi:hypothetical protein